jgi:class 3 adenylate cyclase
VRAARAALALQRAAGELAAAHPGWPVFRAAVNTGPAIAGVVGDRGHRVHAVFGDTVNLGARLEGHAPPGGVCIGERTLAQLPPGTVADPMPDLHVKGKARPVVAHLLRDVPD